MAAARGHTTQCAIKVGCRNGCGLVGGVLVVSALVHVWGHKHLELTALAISLVGGTVAGQSFVWFCFWALYLHV